MNQKIKVQSNSKSIKKLPKIKPIVDKKNSLACRDTSVR
jgi:hypothetical protein